jgi:tartrate dehydrogenase/decarboxylase/D-malate dehydrogenase
MAFWDEIVEDVSEEYPEVTVASLMFDAACKDIVDRPDEFDVVVASNMFGDVFTDIGASIMGGIGLAPSGNINPSGEYPSLFEPVDGTAPGRAGEGIANPLATVLSSALLFDHLGHERAGDRIRTCIADQLANDGPRTPDIGGSAETETVIADLRQRLADE